MHVEKETFTPVKQKCTLTHQNIFCWTLWLRLIECILCIPSLYCEAPPPGALTPPLDLVYSHVTESSSWVSGLDKSKTTV